MACAETQKVEWTCTKYKENVMTTKMIETDTFVENFTAPENNLSENDQNFYNTIQNRLDVKYQDAINKIVLNFEIKLSKYSTVKQDRIKKIMVEKIESKISHILMQYPQDIALPKSINNKYLSYTLLKFELMK
jgi:hypothetical protein